MDFLSLVSADGTRLAEWAYLEARAPGLAPKRIGILLRDVAPDQLHLKVWPNWWVGLMAEDEAELWSELSDDLNQRAQRASATEVLDWLDDTASHAVQISTRKEIRISVPETSLESLYQLHLASRVPQYGLSTLETSRATLQSFGRRVTTKFSHIGVSSRKILQGAFAATLLIGAASTGIRTHEIVSPLPAAPRQLSTAVTLTLPVGYAYHSVLMNLDAESKASRLRIHHHKHERRRTGSHRHFTSQPVIVPYQSVQLAVLEPPDCCDFVPSERKGSPDFLFVQPELPAYQRPPQRRLVRILAAMATPFRLIASR